MTGDYHLAGKVLVLPIMGNGTFNVTLINTKSFMNITSKIIKKPNIEYLHIIKCDLELYPEDIRMQFENLFNGDPTLGTQMNVFLNENSQTIFDELKGPFNVKFSKIFKSIVNNIFDKFPLKDLFIK